MSTDGIAVEIGNVYVVVGFPTFVPKRRGRKAGEASELQPYIYTLNAETFEKFGGGPLAHACGYPYATLVYGTFLRVVELCANRVPADVRGRTIIAEGARLRAWTDDELAAVLCYEPELWRRVADDLCRLRKLRRESFTLRVAPADVERYRAAEPVSPVAEFADRAPLFANSGITPDVFLRAIAPTKQNKEPERNLNLTPDRETRPATPAGELPAATPVAPATATPAADAAARHRDANGQGLPQTANESCDDDALLIALARSVEQGGVGQAGNLFVRLILERLCPAFTSREWAAVQRVFAGQWASVLGPRPRMERLRNLWRLALEVAADPRNVSPIAVWLAAATRRK